MKTGTRKALAAMLALALSTTVFTGCSKEETSSVDISNIISSSTSNLTNPIGGDIDSGKLFRDEMFDMRYKHWYDNPEVVESQKDIFEAAMEGTDTGEKYMNTFQIYRDPSGYKYYISGRTPVYLTGDSTDNNGAWQLRDPNTGTLRYVDEISNDIAKISDNLSPSADYTDYIGDKAFADLDGDIKYDVYLNNISVGATYSVDRGTMPISSWLEKYNLAALKLPESMVSNPELYTDLPDVPTLFLCTGAGQCEITFATIDDPDDTEWDGCWMIEYKAEGFEQAAKKSEIAISNGVLSATPRAIETVLGFKIFVDNDSKTINIITDNKDLAGENSTIDTTPVTPPETDEDPGLIEQSTPETSEPDTSTSEPDTSEPEAPKWTEEPASGTYYINTQDAFARAEAIIGAAAVKRFDLNDQVTVTAKTDTGYYKLTDGSFVHGDYISSEKTIITQPDPPASSTPSAPSSSSTPSEPKTPTDTTGMTLDENGLPANPSRGDTFVDSNGQEWIYGGRNGWAKQGAPSSGSTKMDDWLKQQGITYDPNKTI